MRGAGAAASERAVNPLSLWPPCARARASASRPPSPLSPPTHLALEEHAAGQRVRCRSLVVAALLLLRRTKARRLLGRAALFRRQRRLLRLCLLHLR